MKFSTRARYGLRMMVELTREVKKAELVQLNKLAHITGLSENYLAQLAMPLKNGGLIIGVSGKHGGYKLGRPAGEIRVSDVVDAVIGPISLTDCSASPHLCLYSSFCATRLVWSLATHRVNETLHEFTLADLADEKWMERMQQKHQTVPQMFPDRIMQDISDGAPQGCPASEESV
jgi:Rrf2 family protein